MLILGLIVGLVLGALLMNLAVEEERRVNDLLKRTINNLEDDLDAANLRVKNRDNLMKDYQEEHEILLNNSAELRSKVTDLENNIEFLVNQLPKQKREIIR